MVRIQNSFIISIPLCLYFCDQYFLLCSVSGNHWFLFYPYRFTFSRMSYEWHIQYIVFCVWPLSFNKNQWQHFFFRHFKICCSICLIFHFQFSNDYVEHLVLCSLVTHISYLAMYLFRSFAQFVIFSYCRILRALYMFWIQVLFQKWDFCNLLSLSKTFGCILLRVSFIGWNIWIYSTMCHFFSLRIRF